MKAIGKVVDGVKALLVLAGIVVVIALCLVWPVLKLMVVLKFLGM